MWSTRAESRSRPAALPDLAPLPPRGNLTAHARCGPRVGVAEGTRRWRLNKLAIAGAGHPYAWNHDRSHSFAWNGTFPRKVDGHALTDPERTVGERGPREHM